MIRLELVGLDSSALCPVGSGHFLTSKTAHAFQQMAQAAQNEGIPIAIASSYRSFDRQSLIWNRKFRGEAPVFDSNSIAINNWHQLSDEARIFFILRWSALPGASRHHWGTDLDIYAPSLLPPGQKLQLISSEYDEKGYFGILTQWLDEHMHEFGFFRPYATDQGGVAPEPWHISYYEEAVQFQELLTVEMLEELFIRNPVDGQNTIRHLLPTIWERFIINIFGKNSL
jgi:D-alanyl-D-alanine carboxypeptidase